MTGDMETTHQDNSVLSLLKTQKPLMLVKTLTMQNASAQKHDQRKMLQLLQMTKQMTTLQKKTLTRKMKKKDQLQEKTAKTLKRRTQKQRAWGAVDAEPGAEQVAADVATTHVTMLTTIVVNTTTITVAIINIIIIAINTIQIIVAITTTSTTTIITITTITTKPVVITPVDVVAAEPVEVTERERDDPLQRNRSLKLKMLNRDVTETSLMDREMVRILHKDNMVFCLRRDCC